MECRHERGDRCLGLLLCRRQEQILIWHQQPRSAWPGLILRQPVWRGVLNGRQGFGRLLQRFQQVQQEQLTEMWRAAQMAWEQLEEVVVGPPWLL